MKFILWGNFKIGTRILGITVTMAIFIAIIGGIGYYCSANLAKDLQIMYEERLMVAQGLNATRNNIHAIEADMWRMAASQDKAERQIMLNDIQARRADNDKFLNFYETLTLDSTEKQKLQEFKDTLVVFRANTTLAFEMIEQEKQREAVIQIRDNASPPLVKLVKTFEELVIHNEKKSADLQEEGRRDAAMAVHLIIGVTIFALVCGLFLGYVLANMIATRLKTVSGVLNEVADGNLSLPELVIRADDEIGHIGHDLNRMVKNVRGLIGKVAESVEQVASASEQLTASSEQSAQAVNQVALSISDSAEDAEKQSIAVNTTLTLMGKVAALRQQIAEKSAEIDEVSLKAEQAATAGTKSVDKAINQMRNIEEIVNNSAKVVTELGERSKEIGQIVDPIGSIAGQTNLLALNAAIEAARAGEQGKGFAVVAEEVRKLAEQSQDAAKQIGELIGGIQSDTQTAVVTMSEGTLKVKQGTEIVTNSGKDFREISTLVNQVVKSVKVSNEARKNMGESSQQMDESIHRIDEFSKDILMQSQTISAASEEQSAAMEEIASSSQSLAELAQKLQNEIRKFQI